jgi:hypothetical protein
METATLADTPVVERTESAALPWHCHATVLGATSIVVGILWDISWHRTIGRDTFWTPAHLAIYLGGVLGGLSCGWLVLKTTFAGGPEERAGGVRCWGFRGPLGAWVVIWGAFAMLTSAPFDNWWHDAYGLDVQIISPPHSILAAGMYAVTLGAMLLVLREQNISGAGPAPGRKMLAYAAGVLIALIATMVTEYSFPNHQHTGRFYRISCAIYPLILVGMARATKLRWAATLIALAYMSVTAGMAWILPLFPGRPLLGPIYNPVDHMVALPFPLLLVVPALALDLLRNRVGAGRGWKRDWPLALLSGVVFFVIFLVVQWNFSKFLISPAADNWFFVENKWEYGNQVGNWCHQFWDVTNPEWNPPASAAGLGAALILAMISARIGLSLGNWMAKVKR